MQNCNRVGRTGGGRTKLGLKCGVEPRDKGAAFGVGGFTRRPLSLGTASALRGAGATLRNELRVQIAVILKVCQVQPQSTGERRCTARGGAGQLGLEGGTDHGTPDASLFPAELNEVAPCVRAVTLEDGRGHPQGTGDFGRGRASRSGDSSFESLLPSADELGVSAANPCIEQLTQTAVQVGTMLSQARFGHGGPAPSLESSDSTAGSNRPLKCGACPLAGISLESRVVLDTNSSKSDGPEREVGFKHGLAGPE